MAAPTSNFSGRHGSGESGSSAEQCPCPQGEIRTLTQRRCPYGDGKNVAEQRIYPIPWGAPRTMYPCSCYEHAFSATRHPPLAHVKTPLARMVQVLAALTEGGGINAATRLYGMSKKSIYRWQERRSDVINRCWCLPCPVSFYTRSWKALRCTHESRSRSLPTRPKAGPGC